MSRLLGGFRGCVGLRGPNAETAIANLGALFTSPVKFSGRFALPSSSVFVPQRQRWWSSYDLNQCRRRKQTVVTPDKNEAVKWKQRITNNSDELHVVIKDGTFEHLDPERIERDGFTYLGVSFRYQCHKDRRGRWKMHSLEWKAAKQDEWRTKWQEAKPRTFRDMAIWIGRCVFISMLNKEPVQLQNEGRQLIAHAREMGRIVQGCTRAT